MARTARATGPLDWATPGDESSEEAVVGECALWGDTVIDVVRPIVQPEHIEQPHLASILKAIYELSDSKTPIDPMSIANKVKENGGDKGIDAVYVASLTDTKASYKSVEYHAQRVQHYHLARRLHKLCIKWAKQSLGEPNEDLVSAAAAELSALTQDSTSSVGLTDMRGLHDEWLRSGGTRACLSTGIKSLDGIVRMQPDYLVVVGARPKTGKTSLVVDLAVRFSGTQQGAGVFYSLEMAGDRLLRKFNARLCPHGEYKRRESGGSGLLTTSDLLAEHAERTYKLPIRIVDGIYGIEAIAASVRHEIRRDPSVAYIMIDYIEMISTTAKCGTPVETLNHICRSLVALKKEIRRPIFLLSQLRRPDGGDAGAEPGMSELKGSGLIEQSADVMLLLWEGGMSDAEAKMGADSYRKIKMKVVQRDGPHGVINLRYYPQQSLFGEWAFGGTPT